jgi:hypothetical protein
MDTLESKCKIERRKITRTVLNEKFKYGHVSIPLQFVLYTVQKNKRICGPLEKVKGFTKKKLNDYGLNETATKGPFGWAFHVRFASRT